MSGIPDKDYQAALAGAREKGTKVSKAATNGDGFVWEEPPKKRGGRHDHAHDAALAAVPRLRQRPGAWAKVCSFSSATGASQAATRLRKSELLDDLEVTSRRLEDGTSAVYVRLVEA